MVDDVLLNKAATIERCVARAREEYTKDVASFASDHTRQDAAILNLQRACEAAIDAGHRLIRLRALGLPQSARDVFNLLESHGLLDSELAEVMRRMTGFRNIAVHDYQSIELPIVIAIIQHHTADLLAFASLMVHEA